MSEMGYEGVLTLASGAAQHVKDVNIDLSGSEVDDTTRAHEGWKSRRTGLKQWGVSFQMVKKEGDSVFNSLRTAFQNGTAINCSTTDEFGDTISGNVYVQQMSQSEPLDGVVVVDVILLGNGKPTFS